MRPVYATVMGLTGLVLVPASLVLPLSVAYISLIVGLVLTLLTCTYAISAALNAQTDRMSRHVVAHDLMARRAR